MPTLFWDASGLAKQYAPEIGRPTALALFAHRPAPRMVTTPWGYAETYSLLLRKRNGRILLSPASFAAATSALRNDMIILPQFRLPTVTDAAILAGITHIQKHSLNSTDAALLVTFLRYAQTTGEACALVAADGRFCRAAQAEGLAAINPEIMPAADVPAFLAAL